MKRTYPAAILAALMTLVDARQRQVHSEYSTQTVTGFGGRYILGRSKDYRTLSVTFEPSSTRKAEISREIERLQLRIAELEPLAAERVSGDGASAVAKRQRVAGNKRELAQSKARLEELTAESETIDVGYRDEFDLAALAEQTRFALAVDSEDGEVLKARRAFEDAAAQNALLLDDIVGRLGFEGDASRDEILAALDVALNDAREYRKATVVGDVFDDGQDGSDDALGNALDAVTQSLAAEQSEGPNEGDDAPATHDALGMPLIQVDVSDASPKKGRK